MNAEKIKKNSGLCKFPPTHLVSKSTPRIMTKKLTFLNFFALFFTIMLLNGCGGYITQEVYIPTKCQVEKMPVAPKRDSSDFQSLKDNLEYYEQMEIIAKQCAEEAK